MTAPQDRDAKAGSRRPASSDPALAESIRSIVERRVFETAVHRTRMPMALADPNLPDCPLVYVNGAFEALTGYTSAEVIGRNCRFLQGPDTDPVAVRRITQAVRERCDLDEEIYNYQQDGTGFWNGLYISPVYDGHGHLTYFFASQVDVTARKEMLRRQQMLLAELQHRTRNLLAVVNAISKRTVARSRSLGEFASDFESRLGALSRVQGLMARSADETMELRAMVDAELAAYAEQGAGKITVAGPPVRLAAAVVQILALAIHELATNAIKYGALGQANARLDVAWQVQASGGERRLLLDWCESGVAMPAAVQLSHQGYGRELIEGGLSYQLNSPTTLDLTPDGARCRISMLLNETGGDAG